MTTKEDDPKVDEPKPDEKPEPKPDEKITEKDLTAKITEVVERLLAKRGDDDDDDAPSPLANMRSLEEAAATAVRNAIESAGIIKPAEKDDDIDIQKQIDDGIKAAMKEFEKQPRKLRKLTKALWGDDE